MAHRPERLDLWRYSPGLLRPLKRPFLFEARGWGGALNGKLEASQTMLSRATGHGRQRGRREVIGKGGRRQSI